jgi:hypothetical protein
MIPRIYDKLTSRLKPGKALIILGPRRVGKTTLLKKYLSETKLKFRLESGDSMETRDVLSSDDFDRILEYVDGFDLIAVDEAQRAARIGWGFKIIVDQAPKVRVLATGSSSFELSGQIGEPLTGRKNTLVLYPVSQMELGKTISVFDLKNNLPQYLIFGGYPEVITSKSKNGKIKTLQEIINSYLFKDILEFEKIKNSKTLLDLLKLVAFQVGQEVSLTELGRQLQLDYKTVYRYLDLLEKSFVLFNLRGLSRNLRGEIRQKSKWYFLDNGVMNAVISNFNNLDTREDAGRLWENFLVSERLKKQEYGNIYANNYFWRTWEQKEIDWIEERGGVLHAFEFKWHEKKVKKPAEFFTAYPHSEFHVVTQENYLEFVG